MSKIMNRQEFEALGDKHKKYESLNQQYFMDSMPIMVRLDGRAFHTFAKGLARPYDFRLTTCMQEAAKAILDQTNGLTVYTQSDEITCILPASEQMLFGGRKSKIESVLAAIASVAFYKALVEHLPEKTSHIPVFDCRAWQYPNPELCVESLVWRETDATRNSLTMACSSLYSQKELHGKGRAIQHDMLHAKGVNWNDYPAFFKRGTYFAKRYVEQVMDQETWNKIPEKNKPVSREFTRSIIVNLDLPPITQVKNMFDVVFHGDSWECYE